MIAGRYFSNDLKLAQCFVCRWPFLDVFLQKPWDWLSYVITKTNTTPLLHLHSERFPCWFCHMAADALYCVNCVLHQLTGCPLSHAAALQEICKLTTTAYDYAGFVMEKKAASNEDEPFMTVMTYNKQVLYSRWMLTEQQMQQIPFYCFSWRTGVHSINILIRNEAC